MKERFPKQAAQAARLTAVEEQLDQRINKVRRRLLYKVSTVGQSVRVHSLFASVARFLQTLPPPTWNHVQRRLPLLSAARTQGINTGMDVNARRFQAHTFQVSVEQSHPPTNPCYYFCRTSSTINDGTSRHGRDLLSDSTQQ